MESNKKRFQEMERRAAQVIEVITNMGIKYEESEEKVDMCQALLEIRMEAQKEGEKIGEQKGELKKAKETAKSFYKLGVNLETIAQGVGYTVETVKEWIGLE